MIGRSKWILILGLMVGMYGTCMGASEGSNTYYEDGKQTVISEELKFQTGVFVSKDSFLIMQNDFISCTQLYIYGGGTLYAFGNLDFSKSTEFYLPENPPSNPPSFRHVCYTGKIEVGTAEGEVVFESPNTNQSNFSRTLSNSEGTLTVNGMILTPQLSLGHAESVLNIIGNAQGSQIGELIGKDGSQIKFFPGTVGLAEIAVDKYSEFNGSVYVGVDGIANLAPMKENSYLILPENLVEILANEDRISVSEFFQISEYQISLGKDVLSDESTYTVNGGVLEITDEDGMGVVEIGRAGEHYLLEMVVSGVSDEDAFITWMKPNSVWSISRTEDPENFLLSATFSSAEENILAWDFSKFNEEKGATVSVISLAGRDVPEPSSLALILCGLAGGYCVWRRNRYSAKASS